MATRVLAVVLLVSSGCSFFLRGVEDDWEPPAESECQPFIIVPIVDGALGVGLGAWAIGDPCRDSALNCAIGLAGAAAMIGAGVYGYLKVKRCNEARRAADAATKPSGFEVGGDARGDHGDEHDPADHLLGDADRESNPEL